MDSFSVAYIPKDKPEVRTFIDNVLSSDGYFVTSVATGRRALELVCEMEYEI